MITLISLFIILFCPLLTRTEASVFPQNLEKIAEELNQNIPVMNNAPLPTLPSSHFRTKERLGASFIGGITMLALTSLVGGFALTSTKTRSKVVPLYIFTSGMIVIGFFGRFCKLLPHTNNEATSWVAGAVLGLCAFVSAHHHYNK